jgi:hypothetical protein
MIHSEEEILDQTDTMLPDVNTYNFNEIIITVELPHEDTTISYDVNFQKVSYKGELGWQFQDIEQKN